MTVAAALFGARLPLAETFAGILCDAGVVRGLIGPREVDRIWDRHLLNCAAVAEAIAPGARLIDVGSGAGLPGIVLAIARPDLAVTLLEPLARRVDFLSEVVHRLGLGTVTVLRGRAESVAGPGAAGRNLPGQAGHYDVVTSRAVAALDVLTQWCLPLARPGGTMLAIKGAGAEAELRRTTAAMTRAGATDIEVLRCGSDLLAVPTTVVRAIRSAKSTHRSAR